MHFACKWGKEVSWQVTEKFIQNLRNSDLNNVPYVQIFLWRRFFFACYYLWSHIVPVFNFWSEANTKRNKKQETGG